MLPIKQVKQKKNQWRDEKHNFTPLYSIHTKSGTSLTFTHPFLYAVKAHVNNRINCNAFTLIYDHLCLFSQDPFMACTLINYKTQISVIEDNPLTHQDVFSLLSHLVR